MLQKELSEIGVDTPRNVVVKNNELLDSLPFEFPVVIKALGLSHKTENRGVRLGLSNAEELKIAFGEMAFSEYLIEEMISDVISVKICFIRLKVINYLLN